MKAPSIPPPADLARPLQKLRRMPRHLTLIEKNEQPINWRRAILSGMVASTLLMGFVDIFKMLGITEFSFEVYLGSLITGRPTGAHAWTFGFLANWLTGGLFGVFYAYCFEYVFRRSDPRLGAGLGLGHAVLAAVAFFPFFGILHQQIGTGAFPDFAFFGSGMEPATPILLLFAHLLFGSCMGLFYGPVRAARIRTRVSEPGVFGQPGESQVISAVDDPRDAVGY